MSKINLIDIKISIDEKLTTHLEADNISKVLDKNKLNKVLQKTLKDIGQCISFKSEGGVKDEKNK